MQCWSRIIDTDLGQSAQAVYLSDPARSYHNWDHILRLYWHAENTFELPYDADLDKAILAHDVIYDAAPDKEVRSADWLTAQSNQDERAAVAHILNTIEHRPSKDNRMVLLDLADFLDPACCIPNLDRIAAESMALYGVSMEQFLAANKAVMTGLMDRISTGMHDVPEHADREWFAQILAGMQRSIRLVDDRLQATPDG